MDILIGSLSLTPTDARDVTNSNKYHMIVAYKGHLSQSPKKFKYEEAVGIVTWLRNFDPAYVTYAGVGARYRGLAIGKALVRAFEVEMTVDACGMPKKHIVSGNTPTAGFWVSIGYRVMTTSIMFDCIEDLNQRIDQQAWDYSLFVVKYVMNSTIVLAVPPLGVVIRHFNKPS